jgi:hypothetical protein
MIGTRNAGGLKLHLPAPAVLAESLHQLARSATRKEARIKEERRVEARRRDD